MFEITGVIVPDKPFQTSLIFVRKGGSSLNGRLLALPAYIRLECKWTPLANTLAYYDTATSTAVKCFIVQALGKNAKIARDTYLYEASVTKK